jgi:cellulose synthase/poly-beta-1,6-N-acetylglucosamine synthase-like glycosyltransferase
MVEFVTAVYLVFMFVALYMFSFFIILTVRNRDKLFSYPKPRTDFFVSVMIPAYNEEENIEETVRHVMDSDYPKKNLEVIVINDGSSDGTLNKVKGLLKKYGNLKLINKENSGKADSLNQAVKIAKGELVAVVDSDSFIGKESLKKLTGFFADKNIGTVTSFVKVRDQGKNFFARLQSIEYLILGWSRNLMDLVDSVWCTNGPLSLYRKEYVEKVGGFSKETVTEDIDMTWNMLHHGYKTGMCLDADVTTVVPEKFGAWFRQRTRWGLGGLQAITKYRSSVFKKGMFGLFIIPYVAFTIIFSVFAFLFSSYLIFKSLLTRVLSTGYSVAVDSTLFRFEDVNLHPSILIFFLVVLFVLSTSYAWYVIQTTKFEKRLDVKRFLTLIFYTLVYLALYPVVWFVSIYRFIRKDYRW